MAVDDRRRAQRWPAGGFERFIRAGGGYAGIHSAADTEYDWKWYGRLVGAYFLSHPSGTYPNGGREGTVVVEDTTDRSTQGVPAPRWGRIDEWYNYKPVNFEQTGNVDYSPRADVHVLASLDESTYDEADGSDGVDDDHPISWCHKYDGGRAWYTGMGHTDDSFTETPFLRHILGGIEDAAGMAGSDICNLSPTVQATADPKTGNAPLLVQFSANGADPEGRRSRTRGTSGTGARRCGRTRTTVRGAGHLQRQGHREGLEGRHGDRHGADRREQPARERRADRVGRG